MLLQAISWAFFSLSVLILIAYLVHYLLEHIGFSEHDVVFDGWMQYFERRHLPSLLSAGLGGVLAQGLNALSLLVYQGMSLDSTAVRAAAAAAELRPATRWSDIFLQGFTVALFFNLEKGEIFCFGLFVCLFLFV